MKTYRRPTKTEATQVFEDLQAVRRRPIDAPMATKTSPSIMTKLCFWRKKK